MEKDINMKCMDNNMKKISYIFIALFMVMFTPSAFSNSQILYYDFEEGGGSVAQDQSGNNIDALISGATHDGSDREEGIYSLLFSTATSYFTPLTSQNIPDGLTISYWIKCDNDGDPKTFFTIFDGGHTHFSLKYDNVGGDDTTINWYGVDMMQHTQVVYTEKCLTGVWEHHVVTLNTSTSRVTYRLNNILRYNNTLTPLFDADNGTTKLMYIGNSKTLTDAYEGNIDEFRVFDFILPQDAIDDIYSNNADNLSSYIDNPVTTPEEDGESPVVFENVETYPIINYTLPSNDSTVNNLMTFEGYLNYPATCDLYLDNYFIERFSNILAFTYDKLFDNAGEHEYFVHCWFIENGTKYFEISPITPFTVELFDRTVQFYLYDKDDNLFYGENLYVVTPCFREYVGQFSQVVNSKYDYYIQKLDTGIATFNLSYTQKYDFCLARGQINYIDDAFSKRFDLVEVSKQIELGELVVDNTTVTYQFRLTDADVYNFYEPEFWAKTWSDLFNLLVSTALGGLIVGLGVYMGKEKVIVAGVIVMLVGLGVGTINLIGGILF